MLGFVQNWLAPKCNPIGVDFGSDCLRLAQVQWVDGEHKLIAAASADVPSHLRVDPAGRLNFFVETTRDLLAQGDFKGRAAILGLPAAWMYIQHLRMPKLDEESLRKALPFEARGKLPIDPAQALLRHLVAGDVYQDQEPKTEVILMAAKRELVNQFLAAAAKAKLDVIGMNVEPKAILDCFNFVHRRKSDQEVTQCFVDIGCGATRAMITRGGQILFARTIPIGGDHFNRAVSQAMKVTADDARLLRIKLCHQPPALDERREKQEFHAEASTPKPAAAAAAAFPSDSESTDNSFALLSAGMAASSRKQEMGIAEVVSATATAVMEAPTSAQATAPATAETLQARAAEQACMEPLGKLVEELDLCRRYYEATFPSKPVERLVFVGGEARQRSLCQHIARGLGLAAQVGDPMVRMGRVSEIGVESGLDRRQPQPTWAVAIGLSMGPSNVSGQ
ncbi:MAG: pilus assembly protein PilM [Planctomycetota bacterium]|nr:pilus assembly protein PilM [Planctomycetota bacterium]